MFQNDCRLWSILSKHFERTSDKNPGKNTSLPAQLNNSSSSKGIIQRIPQESLPMASMMALQLQMKLVIIFTWNHWVAWKSLWGNFEIWLSWKTEKTLASFLAFVNVKRTLTTWMLLQNCVSLAILFPFQPYIFRQINPLIRKFFR